MSDDAVTGYGIVTMVAEAVAEVGDDPAAIAEYLHAKSSTSTVRVRVGLDRVGRAGERARRCSARHRGSGPGGRERGRRLVDRALLNRTEPLVPYEPLTGRPGAPRTRPGREALPRAPRRHGRDVRGRRGRDRRPRRPERRREDDAAEGDRWHARADARADRLRRHATSPVARAAPVAHAGITMVHADAPAVRDA